MISIITTTYNDSKYFRRLYDSLETQTYNDFELIVIDDGSVEPFALPPDCTDFPITVIRQENRGLSCARNKGLSVARGEFVKFVDIDDELMPKCLELQLNSTKGPGMISLIGFREVYEGGGPEIDIIPAFSYPLDALMLMNLAPPHALLYFTSDVRHAGGFCEGPRVKGGHEDYDLLFRLLVHELDLVSVHAVGVVYHRRVGSMSTNQTAMASSRARVWIYNASEVIYRKALRNRFHVASVILGLSFILENTDCEILKSEGMAKLVELIASELSSGSFSISVSETRQLVLRLSRSLLPVPNLLSALNQKLEVSPLHNPPQELLNHRYYLQDISDDSDYLETISFVGTHGHALCVYGAGILGSRVLRLLAAMGCTNFSVVDKSYQKIGDINGVRVCNPEVIFSVRFSGVLIASRAYSAEIVKYVRSSPVQIATKIHIF
jgi:glycosyltransferase involved in cell wall biosynthesis